MAQALKQPIIELVQFPIYCFDRSSVKVDRYLPGQAVRLTLVNEPETRAKKRQYGCSLMNSWWKDGSRAGFIMVFQKPG
jgi:hypothetical protein